MTGGDKVVLPLMGPSVEEVSLPWEPNPTNSLLQYMNRHCTPDAGSGTWDNCATAGLLLPSRSISRSRRTGVTEIKTKHRKNHSDFSDSTRRLDMLRYVIPRCTSKIEVDW